MALITASLENSEKTLRRLVILVLLYCIPASQAMVPFIDPDIWWHFRTGQWIFSHGQVPVTDPFSAYGMEKPWVAYSWLFEVLIYALFTKLALIGIPCLRSRCPCSLRSFYMARCGGRGCRS